MQFMLAMLETPQQFDQRTGPDSATYWSGWQAYTAALVEAGVMVSGNGLEGPDTATTVRLRDGGNAVQDGPFADTRELLGGYYIIEVADLDEALKWAARSPCAAQGAVEVRPVLDRMP